MNFEIKEKAIRVINKTEQDTAYFKDTLLIKGNRSSSSEILDNVVVILHKDTFGNPIYIEICAK